MLLRDNCDYGSGMCKKVAEANGFSLGGGGYAFSGDFNLKGCYAYDEGTYAGMAFYGKVNGGEVTSASQLNTATSPKFRINTCMDRKGLFVLADPGGDCPGGFEHITSDGKCKEGALALGTAPPEDASYANRGGAACGVCKVVNACCNKNYITLNGWSAGNTCYKPVCLKVIQPNWISNLVVADATPTHSNGPKENAVGTCGNGQYWNTGGDSTWPKYIDIDAGVGSYVNVILLKARVVAEAPKLTKVFHARDLSGNWEMVASVSSAQSNHDQMYDFSGIIGSSHFEDRYWRIQFDESWNGAGPTIDCIRLGHKDAIS
jgi:hypothetical protein